MKNIIEGSIRLLMDLIRTQSFSKEEDQTAEIIDAYLKENGVETHRELNNVWAFNKYYDPSKPTILLNSHHDTVHPNKDYTRDPFHAEILDGKLFGLGSNDAGGCLVSLIGTFLHYYDKQDLFLPNLDKPHALHQYSSDLLPSYPSDHQANLHFLHSPAIAN